MRLRFAQVPSVRQVSSGNPCPFLRALVADGTLPDGLEPVKHIASALVDAAKKGEGAPTLPAPGIYAVAFTANGFGPSNVLHNLRHGVQLNALRNGPYDKRGAGSRILNGLGQVDPEQLARLAEFATEKTSLSGVKEPGLSLHEINVFMEANFKRAKDRRRHVDRLLMRGEWPVLLAVMGKDSSKGRYLSVQDVRQLIVERRLPERMRQ